MKTTVLLLMLLPAIAVAQNSNNLYPHQQEASRILAYFIGAENVQRYVTLDRKKSKQLTSKSFLFHYNFRHPKFSGETFTIKFTLDSTGQFIRDQATYGIIHVPLTSDSTWTEAKEALRICNDQARRLKRSSLRLIWDTTDVSYDIFEKTHNVRDISAGNLVWKVDGEVLFRGARYKGTFDVNVFTGAVTRRFAIPWD